MCVCIYCLIIQGCVRAFTRVHACNQFVFINDMKQTSNNIVRKNES